MTILMSNFVTILMNYMTIDHLDKQHGHPDKQHDHLDEQPCEGERRLLRVQRQGQAVLQQALLVEGCQLSST